MTEKIRNELISMSEAKYRDFSSALMPTVCKDRVLGIRVPALRKYAKSIAQSGQASAFLNSLPHEYFEENNLHAFLICNIKDYGKCIEELNRFLPYIDNWATCDSLTPECFKKHKNELLCEIEKWLRSEHEYTVRFAIRMLMVFFLDEDFCEEYLLRVSKIRSEKYYINMMIAWYFATALSKQYESAVKYLEKEKLDKWVHNKTIQKANESFRIHKEIKEYLDTLKIKKGK